MKSIVIITQILLISLWASAQSTTEGIRFIEGEKWEKILKMAQEQDKYIFMDCYTSWCGPCKALAKDVFTQKEAGDFFNAHFINVKYDMEKGIGKELRKQYQGNIIGYPTLLLINQEGKVVHQMAGFQETGVLIAGMKAGMEGKSLFTYQERYASGERELDFIKAYVGALEGAFMRDKIEQVVTDYMKSIPLEKLKEKEIWELVEKYVKNPYSPQFEFVVFNLDYFPLKLKTDRYNLERQLGWALEKALSQIIELKRDKEGKILGLVEEPGKIDTLLRLINRAGLKHAEEYRAKIKIYQLELADEWEKVWQYLTICRDIRALGYSERFLNEVVQYMSLRCKDRTLLENALALMEELQEKEDREGGKLKSCYYDTLALLHRQLGNTAKADEYRIMDEKMREQKNKEFENFMKGVK